MKPLLPTLAAALVTLPLASARQTIPPPLITTTGNAQIRVVPDLADLDFEIEVRNVDLGVARKQQAARTTRVLAALRASGVSEADLQSSQVKIMPDYTDRRQESDKIKFWSVSQRISCTLHDVTRVPDVTTATVAAGATGVRNAVLRTSQLRKYRDEARANAIRAAKEKAVALATVLGARVGKSYTIQENASHNWSPSFLNNSQVQTSATADDQPEEAGMPAFAPGTISITAGVTVSFVLE